MGKMSNQNVAPGRYGRNHSPFKVEDAHSKRSEVVDVVNKFPNGSPVIYSNDVRGELASLFNHHPRILQEKYFDHHPYRDFGIFTKLAQKTHPQLYSVLCEQYREAIIQHNQDTQRGSLIERSYEELYHSDDIVMIMFQDRLVGAIRTQAQIWNGEKNGMYQRGSLIVLREFRRSLDVVNLSHLLITTINKRNASKPLYSVIQTENKSALKSNELSGFEYMLVKNMAHSYPEVYNEIVEARGGEDFRDLQTGETPEDYAITFNAAAKKKFRSMDPYWSNR